MLLIHESPDILTRTYVIECIVEFVVVNGTVFRFPISMNVSMYYCSKLSFTVQKLLLLVTRLI